MEAIKDFNIKSAYEIEGAFNRIDRTFSKSRQAKFSADYVFDEDKSVKWNREEVQRKNSEIDDYNKLVVRLKAESTTNLTEAIGKYIIEELDSCARISCSRSTALAIWAETLKHHEDNPWDWVDEMIESAANIITSYQQED